MQGKKDGIRTALALLGTDHILELNRGGTFARIGMETHTEGRAERKSRNRQARQERKV